MCKLYRNHLAHSPIYNLIASLRLTLARDRFQNSNSEDDAKIKRQYVQKCESKNAIAVLMCDQTATERIREQNSKSERKTKAEKQERDKYKLQKMREQDGCRKRNATAE